MQTGRRTKRVRLSKRSILRKEELEVVGIYFNCVWELFNSLLPQEGLPTRRTAAQEYERRLILARLFVQHFLEELNVHLLAIRTPILALLEDLLCVFCAP